MTSADAADNLRLREGRCGGRHVRRVTVAAHTTTADLWFGGVGMLAEGDE